MDPIPNWDFYQSFIEARCKVSYAVNFYASLNYCVSVREEVASAQPLHSRAFYRAVWPTGFGAHILCALNLPPASLLAALKCIPSNTEKTKNTLSVFLSSYLCKSWLGEPARQGCRDGVWGARDGRYQTGAEMASRINARGCWVRALAHPTRTPSTEVVCEYRC